MVSALEVPLVLGSGTGLSSHYLDLAEDITIAKTALEKGPFTFQTSNPSRADDVPTLWPRELYTEP